jgi:hypothetical protein
VGSILDVVIRIFHLLKTSGPGPDSTSNRNEYQAYFLVDKRGADNFTTFKCRMSTNMGASNSWKPPGLY